MVCSTVSGASDHPGQPGETHRGYRWGQVPHTAPTMALANAIHLEGTATPLRRIWIPKRGSRSKAPTGHSNPNGQGTANASAPSLGTRMGSQAVTAHLWLSPRTLLPGCHRSHLYRIGFRPQYALKLDIAKCFDRIGHTALLAKMQAPPGIRRQLKAWLKAGILEDGHLSPTTAGTPQGGSFHRS